MTSKTTRANIDERFWSKVDKSAGDDGCWIWMGRREHYGHGGLAFMGKQVKAHRLSWELAYGPLPNDTGVGSVGTVVCHRCDNPPCVNPKHLFIGTQRDNVLDRDSKGRGGCHKGTSNGRHKLTEADVVEIRKLYASGAMSGPKLAAKYGVYHSTIYDAVRRERWAHVP